MKKVVNLLCYVVCFALMLGFFNIGIKAEADTVEQYFVLAEDFDSAGTWTLTAKDTLSGDSVPAIFGDYVFDGLRSYNENAYTSADHTINIQKAGTYRVWVRGMTHSVVSGNDTSWKFKAAIDNTQLSATFGGYTGTNTYVWQDGGTIELSAGSHVFKLQDVYANYAKFNAFFITSDTELVPSEDYATFQEQLGSAGEGGGGEIVEGNSYFVQPSGFTEKGSWTIIDDANAYGGYTLMGSTSQVAGQGSDASVTLEDVAAGSYRIWIHGRELPNTPPQEHAWEFKAGVNGTELTPVFGGGGKTMDSIAFVWEDGGVVELTEGTNTISLVDAWCDYAKCDAIFITSDVDLVPSDYSMSDLEAISVVIKDDAANDPMEEFVITDDFAGGNIVVVSKLGNIVSLDNKVDPEEGSNPYFYWYFQATSDIDRTVTFTFSQNKNYTTDLIGNNKVLCSTDGGETWSYTPAVSNKTFTYTFKAGEIVRFSNVLPYVLADYNDYVEANNDNPRVEFTTLREKAVELGLSTDTVTFQSKEGRDIPLAVIGNQNAKNCIVYTSRHHSCETIGSYTLEGMMDYMLNDASDSFLNTYCIYVVPMVDIDGVENGEQGKGRGGLDHNRDYGLGNHVEVTAITTFFTEVFKTQTLKVFLDSHAPGSVTTGLGNHLSYGSIDDGNPYGTQDMEIALQPLVLQYSDILDEIENADASNDKLTYDPNNAWRAYGEDGMARVWFARQADNYDILATTLETSFTATPNDHYPENTGRWGEQISEAVTVYLDLYDEEPVAEIYEVVFKDTLGNTLATVEVTEGDTVDPASIPTAPSRYGYTFTDWSYDVETPIMTDMVITALYEKDGAMQYKVSVSDDVQLTLPNDQTECFYNDRIKAVTARQKDGKNFSYWKVNGGIFSYSHEISFLAFGDVEMEAVYGELPGNPNKYVVFTDSNATVTDHKNGKYDMHVMGVVFGRSSEVSEIGVILGAGDYTAEEMIDGTAITVKLKASKATAGRQFVYTVKNISYDQYRTAITYAVIDGVTYYSDISCVAVVETPKYGGDDIIEEEGSDPFN